MNTIDRLLMVISATRYLPPFGEEHKENFATPICGCSSVKVLGLVVRGSRLFRSDVDAGMSGVVLLVLVPCSA